MNKDNRKLAKHLEEKILAEVVDAKKTIKLYEASVVNEERLKLLEELKENAENLHEFETDLQSAKANNLHSVEAYFS